MKLTKEMKDEYTKLFNSMEVTDNQNMKVLINKFVNTIEQNKDKYIQVEKTTGVPWKLIATIHCMEAGLSFKRNLHNGQRWDKVTTIVPHGKGPFTSWVKSSVDAMSDLRNELKGSLGVKKIKWNLEIVMYTLEKHNGFGYRKYRNIYSPYLWSFSNHYTKGKYAYDGKYDPELVSKQIGAMVIYKLLAKKKLIEKELVSSKVLYTKIVIPVVEPVVEPLSTWEKFKGWFS